MRVHVQPSRAAGEPALNVDLHVDLHDVHLEPNNGLWSGSLQTVFLQLNRRGEIIQALDETLQLSLPENVYEEALKEGLRNTKQFRFLPGAAQICVVLRDPWNGNIGSLSVPLERVSSAVEKP